MALKLWEWITRAFRWKDGHTSLNEVCSELERVSMETHVRELAFWTCANLVANVISKSEFKTYLGGKEVQEEEYFLWNYSPNINENSSAFIHKWIAALYRCNECLLVEHQGRLHVADSFNRDCDELRGDRFSDIAVGQSVLTRTRRRQDVLFFELSARNVYNVVQALSIAYQRLLDSAVNGYTAANGGKYKFSYDTIPPAYNGDREQYYGELSRIIKPALSADTAIVPTGKGENIELLNKGSTYGNSTTRDIRSMINDISDFTAKGFLIPPALVRGDVQDTSDAVDQLLTFCIDPLTDMLSEEITRQRYGYEGFRNGNYLRIDTRQVRHVDLLSMAPNVDKLISSGVSSVNDIIIITGGQPIDEPWADEHFMTRNYETIKTALQNLNTGGESA